MKTENISVADFEKYLREHWGFPDKDSPDNELENGTFLGAIGSQIFTFTIDKGIIVSMEDIPPTKIPFPQSHNDVSQLDIIFEDCLDENCRLDYARRLLIELVKDLDIEKMTAQECIYVSSIISKTDQTRFMENFPIRDNIFKNESSKNTDLVRFVLKAIQQGVLPWEIDYDKSI